MTARRALTELVTERILARSQGVGTFVSDSRPMSSILEIRSIDDEINQRGHRYDPSRTIRAPRGNQLNAKSWQTEAPLRMLMNNLDPEVAEHPHSLVVYAGIGRAARDWQSYDKDRYLSSDIENANKLLVNRSLLDIVDIELL